MRPLVYRQVRDVPPTEDHMSAGWLILARDQVEQRRLARTIRPDDRVDRATLYVQADFRHRDQATELFAQML